jgi:peroxiredoxin
MALLPRLKRSLGVEARLTNIVPGTMAPHFSLKALDGQHFSLDTLLLRGPVVAAFFKISCPVCQFTFPFLQRISERFAGKNVSVIGISQDDARSTKQFNQEFGVTFPTLLDGRGYPVSNAYGITNVPTVFLISTDGTVNINCMGFDKAGLEKIVETLSEQQRTSPAPLFRAGENVPAHRPG